MAKLRNQDDTVARIRSFDADYFGWQREALASGLDFERAREFLNDDVTADEWTVDATAADVELKAREYLAFAVGKIQGHRGISAERSVTKLAEYAWLLCRDDVVKAMGEAEYAQYGAPKIKAFATGFGWPWPSDDPGLDRMAEGLPCHDGCESGCDA